MSRCQCGQPVSEPQTEVERAHNRTSEVNNNVVLPEEIWPTGGDHSRDDQVQVVTPSGWDNVCLYHVNENNVETCPQIQIYLGNQPRRALIDTGCQCSIISEEMRRELSPRGQTGWNYPLKMLC
jgi:hypothetical protein